jgi:hypothetical protein
MAATHLPMHPCAGCPPPSPPPRAAPHSSLGSGASLSLFSGSSVLVSRPDGARVFCSVPSLPALLHELVRQGRWDKVVRLAR